jgi:peptidoglycan hydrolase-like protein with peptidoglycan-binding domain
MNWDEHFKRVNRKRVPAMFGADFGAPSGGDPNVRSVQHALNIRGANPKLVEDGVYGRATRAALIVFQRQSGIAQTGIIDTATLSKLGLKPSGAEATLPAFAGLTRLPVKDQQALVNAANAIGIQPDWLASVIDFETGGTFSPSVTNAAGSGAVGLIQFMPSTAKALLGTATESEAVAKLKSMTFSEQLEIVKQYFAPYAGKLHSLEDTYLAVFYPAFIGKPNDAVLGHAPSPIYVQNAGFDVTGKGFVTKEDITSKIRQVLASVESYITVPGVAVAAAASSAVLVAIAIGLGILAMSGRVSVA